MRIHSNRAVKPLSVRAVNLLSNIAVRPLIETAMILLIVKAVKPLSAVGGLYNYSVINV